MEDKYVNPNDFKVVSFHNAEDFTFLPEMGCMYDGRAINGEKGSPGIDAGETKVLPYHIGHQLAVNLAKYTLNRTSTKETKLDANGQPIIQAIWDTTRLENLKNSYLTDMYTEDKPVAQTETDKLFAKVAELEKFVKDNMGELPTAAPSVETPEAPTVPEGSNLDQKEQTTPSPVASIPDAEPKKFLDKKQVIDELEKRGIRHDKRKSQADLEKLLA